MFLSRHTIGEAVNIATVRQALLWAEVTTGFRPRTNVERWQIQDQLAIRLRHLGCDARPRFYEGPAGRLTFRLRVGFRLSPSLLHGLERIDEAIPSAG